VIDGKTNTVETTIDASASSGIAVDEETNTIYALSSSELEAINATTGQFEADFNLADDPNSFGGGLAVDPAAGTIYVITNFDDPGDPQFTAMEAVASCRSHVSAPAGSICAQMAAAFEPAAASFSSAADGVVLGTTSCLQVCFQAAMMATADGGKHWTFLSSPPNIGIELFQPPSGSLLFTSADSGWLFGSWHTANSGGSWQRAVPGAIDSVLAAAASKTTVYEAVQPDLGRGELVATPIGGTRWTRVPGISGNATGLATSGNSVFVTSATRLWASADGRVWHSYPARCPGTGYQLAGVTAASPSDVSLLCARPSGSGQARRKEILVSTDGGRTVRLVGPAPSLGVAQGFASPPGDPAVITIAAGGTAKNNRNYWIYRSSNGGKTWTTQTIDSAPGASFASLSFTNRTSGWLVLASRRPEQENILLHTTDGGRTWHQATL